ncbi:MAG: type II toxin-antitoxin system VapC family toxin [Bauldia sp.]|nr:type II toxin-antitoxin system VapC family toxin [Bauldia sp.]
MILPDANVLIPAFRHDAARHAVCRSWLEATARGDARFGISPLVLAAVIRITTNPRIFPEPSSLVDAIGFAEGVLRQANAVIVEPGDRHFGIFTRLCLETRTTGPTVSDAYYAALAIEAGAEWITFDRDFARFPGLRWSAPS